MKKAPQGAFFVFGICHQSLQSRAEQSRAEQSRAEQSRAEQTKEAASDLTIARKISGSILDHGSKVSMRAKNISWRFLRRLPLNTLSAKVSGWLKLNLMP